MAKSIETLNYMSPQVAYRSTIIPRTGGSFIDALNESIQDSGAFNLNDKQKVPDLPVTSQANPGSTKLLIGTTSKELPTVSELLLNSEEYSDRGWEIVYSETNRHKPYTKIPLGTQIYIDSKTGELNWSRATEPNIAATVQTTHSVVPPTEVPSQPAPTKEPQQVSTNTFSGVLEKPGENNKSLIIGSITGQTPTVSHLLKNSGELSKDAWNILAAEVNKDKDFTKISEGTEINYNPSTQEISWHISTTSSAVEKIAQVPVQPRSEALEQLQAISNIAPQMVSQNPFDLTDAVQPYMGKPYREINCYNLLVKGLKKMGLPYTGKDGLRDRLTSMAKERGLPSNAFLNGEGIVSATGRKVLTHSFIQVDNPKEQAGKTFKEMKQLLQKGQILSFSTPTRGHTGIISQADDRWTFINSGRMDNHVAEATLPKEVGEEDLLNEVKNWFKTASDNSESLVVTLGQLEEEKIRSNFNSDFRITKRL